MLFIWNNNSIFYIITPVYVLDLLLCPLWTTVESKNFSIVYHVFHKALGWNWALNYFQRQWQTCPDRSFSTELENGHVLESNGQAAVAT